jgi:thiol-disulfide isomerase/thioredoxin
MQLASHSILRAGLCWSLMLVLLGSAPAGPAGTPLPIDPAAIANLRTKGMRLPPVALPLLNGGRLELPSKPGTPTVIAVFGSWCDPCLAEAAAVEASAKRNPQARFIGLDVLESAEHARAFVSRAGVSFPTVLLTNAAFSKADVTDDDRAKTGIDIPAVYVLDAQGASTRAFVGADPDVAAKIDKALSSFRAPG